MKQIDDLIKYSKYSIFSLSLVSTILGVFIQFYFLFQIDAIVFFSLTQLINDFIIVFGPALLFIIISFSFSLTLKASPKNVLLVGGLLLIPNIFFPSISFLGIFIGILCIIFIQVFIDNNVLKVVFDTKKKSYGFASTLLVGIIISGYNLLGEINDGYRYKFNYNDKIVESFYINDQYVFLKNYNNRNIIIPIDEIEYFIAGE